MTYCVLKMITCVLSNDGMCSRNVLEMLFSVLFHPLCLNNILAHDPLHLSFES